MANKKINELSSRTPALSDLMIVGDPSSGYSYKCTVTALATIIETDIADGYVTIGTTQTISGAKTFSNNLTLTSVVNTPTDPDKFLTLNASNVVTYRTGAEVLSDIGGQASLSGTGLVKSTSGTISYITDNSSNWNTAYNDSIVSAAVSGTTTKTLTLTQQDGGTLTASWSDLNTDAVTSVFGRTGAVVATEGDYSLNLLSDVTLTSPSNGQVLKYNGTAWVNDTDANTGTVTSVGLSSATSGVTIGSTPITTSGTITLAIATASGSQQGLLSSTDWTTFNNKIGGSGTTNYIPKFTSSSAIGNSQIFDNGTSIGIGTTSPAATAKLEVIGDYRQKALVGNANGFNLTINSTTDVVSLTNFYNAAMTFATNNTERMRLDASGNLGLGTSSPVTNLQVNKTTTGISGVQVTNSTTGSTITDGAFFGIDDSQTYVWNYENNPIRFATNNTERMHLGASGNLGLGVSPSAWSTGKAFEVGALGNSLWGVGGGDIILGSNFYYNADFKYASSNYATGYRQQDGVHKWLISSSGTANATISFTQAMTLDASGRLGIGTTSPLYKLDVQGTSGTVAIRAASNTADDILFYATGTVTGTINAFNSNINATANVGANIINTNSSTGGSYVNVQVPNATSGNPRYILTTSGATNWSMGIKNSDSDKLYIGATDDPSNGSPVMTMTTGGNVGIGTTSPTVKLDVAGYIQAADRFYVTNSANNVQLQALSGGSGNIGIQVRNAAGSGSGNFWINSDGGNVGIGTTSPSTLLYAKTTGDGYNMLTIEATGGDAGIALKGGSGGSSVGGWTIQSQNAGSMVFVDRNSTPTERMRITSGGNVGIGTSSPAAKLQVSGGSIRLDDGQALEFGGSTNFILGDNTNNLFRFYTNNSEKMRLTSSGELLINTTSDAGDYKLQVNGNGRFVGTAGNFGLYVSNPSQAGLYLAYTGTGANNVSVSNFNDVFSIYDETNSRYILKSTLSTQAVEFTGSIKTAAPSGGTAKPIKFGEIVTLGGSNTQGVRVEIDGTVYYLVTGYLP